MFSKRVKYAIQVLAEFEKAKRDGVRLNKSFFREQCGLEPAVVSEVLRMLHMGAWVNYVGSAYFSVRDLTESTLYDLMMAVDGRIAMDAGISEGWPMQNRVQNTKAKAITDSMTDNFINEIRNVKLSEMFDCYQTTDRRTLNHIRKNSRQEIMTTYGQAEKH